MTVNYLGRIWNVFETGRTSCPFALEDQTGRAQFIKLIAGGGHLFPQRGLTVMPGLFHVVDGVVVFAG